MSDTERDEQILRAVELYYYEGLTQAAIADRMQCTRWTVGRMLERARESGMVTITINHPHARNRSLEREMRQRFNLEDVVVVPSQDSLESTARLVTSAAAGYLINMRPVPRSMAVSWGRTMSLLARSMPERWTHGLDVYQMYGGLVRSNDDEVGDSIGLMARRGQGVGHMVPAPAIVADVDLGARLKREPSVGRCLVGALKSDVTLFSPGALDTGSVLVKSGYLSVEEMEQLGHQGAVTDLFSHFVNAQGAIVSPELEKRTIAVGLERTRESRLSIAVGYGPLKVAPLWVTASAGFAKVIILDSETCQGILEYQPKN